MAPQPASDGERCLPIKIGLLMPPGDGLPAASAKSLSEVLRRSSELASAEVRNTLHLCHISHLYMHRTPNVCKRLCTRTVPALLAKPVMLSLDVALHVEGCTIARGLSFLPSTLTIISAAAASLRWRAPKKTLTSLDSVILTSKDIAGTLPRRRCCKAWCTLFSVSQRVRRGQPLDSCPPLKQATLKGFPHSQVEISRFRSSCLAG